MGAGTDAISNSTKYPWIGSQHGVEKLVPASAQKPALKGLLGSSVLWFAPIFI
jgi:hypothetical protein